MTPKWPPSSIWPVVTASSSPPSATCCARIEIVYSPLDALNIAAANPGDTVVFLGIGFETTAPTVAATLMLAEQRKLDNFCVLSLHKLVPPVLRALLDDKDGCGVQAFLMPGHVSTILGLEPYGFLA